MQKPLAVQAQLETELHDQETVLVDGMQMTEEILYHISSLGI